MNRTISIITLAHIHQSWQTTNFSQIEIIETEFTTCQGEDDTVRRCLFHKFGVIVSSRFSTITAGNQELLRENQLCHIEELLAKAASQAEALGVTRDKLHEMLDLVAPETMQ